MIKLKSIPIFGTRYRISMEAISQRPIRTPYGKIFLSEIGILIRENNFLVYKAFGMRAKELKAVC
jgi:hypothetical protein